MRSVGSVIIGFRAVAALVCLAPQAAHACPPPAMISAPPQAPGQTDEAYYDQLITMSYPRSWHVIASPTQLPGETSDAFARRLAQFNIGMEQARKRSEAARLVALEQEEAQRWDQAPQVLLVEARSANLVRDGEREWLDTRFRVVKRVRGDIRTREILLRYPAHPMMCGPFYPSFPIGTRLVIFAKPGVFSTENLIGYYDHESARDSRSKALLGPIKP